MFEVGQADIITITKTVLPADHFSFYDHIMASLNFACSKPNCLLSTVRLFICPKRDAGFQAGKASGLSMEMKQRLIERKKKKVEKLAKQPLELIPINDYFIRYSWKLDSHKRKVSVTPQTAEKRILLEKEWSRHSIKQRTDMFWRAEVLMREQKKALEELRKESESLYNEAIKCTPLSELKLACRGPVETLPITDYLPPLGSYKNLEPPFSTDETAVPDDDD